MAAPAIKLLMAASASAAAPAWTPADIDGAGLRWWYDGVGSVSGSNLLDLSSNNFDMSKTGTVNTATEQLNGIDVLQFVGGRYTAATAADWKYLHDGTANVWIMAVAKFGTSSNPGATYGLFGSDGGSTANIGVAFYYDDSGASDSVIVEISRGQSGAARAIMNEAGDLTPNTWHSLQLNLDANNGSANSRIGLQIDGVSPGGATGIGAVSTSNPTYTFQLGAVGNSVVPLTGAIAEIFAYDNGSVDEATAIGYLETKYGL